MPPLPLDLLTALPVEVLQLAHNTNVPRQEPRSSGGGVNIVEERERADEHASAGAEGAG